MEAELTLVFEEDHDAFLVAELARQELWVDGLLHVLHADIVVVVDLWKWGHGLALVHVEEFKFKFKI